MSILLDRREDGSLSCFIDGDLQFDSRDEHIYHEALALPALLTALSRSRSKNALSCALKVLVIGGGDGLTARELLRSEHVTHLHLVDYDPQMIKLAQSQFSAINKNSLADSRVTVYEADARQFVQKAVADGVRYDVIVSDLTSPSNADGALLHHVHFYEQLHSLLGADGLLAVNAASPTATPEAYWSIFNSILLSNLQARPYRINLPSFAAQSYGVDWGFILASPRLIEADELAAGALFCLQSLEKSGELRFIVDAAALRAMFSLPSAVLARQQKALAGSGQSDVLVHYLLNAISVEVVGQEESLVDTAAFDFAALPQPGLETKSYLLPVEVRQALGKCSQVGEEELLVERVFELMPALHRFQTREMISDFLQRPAVFLNSIDIGELVNELLKRALELPTLLKEELVFLNEKLVEYAHDREGLLALGLRSMAVIALVVVMGNIIYPDAVYAKGGHGWGGDNFGYGGGTIYTNPYNRKVITDKQTRVINKTDKGPLIENFPNNSGANNH